MRSTASFLSALALLTYSITAINVDDLILNEYYYCIKYYGALEADVELPPNAIPYFNYNGTTRCPTSFRTDYVSGATLTICPPDSGLDDNNLALAVALSYRSSGGQLDGPIDVVDFAPILITNGSVDPSVFSSDFGVQGIPATLQKDLTASTGITPVWTINGTQAALADSPDETDDNLSMYVSCAYPGSYIYCGGFEDGNVPGPGGCWRDQWIPLNMQTPVLNYTFRFDNNLASVEIWVESEYVTNQGNQTGENTAVFLRFDGDRNLPSVVDYDFWRGSESVYEIEEEFLRETRAMRLEEGSGGLVRLVNDSGRGGGGEWYDSGNGTFSGQSVNGGRGENGCARMRVGIGMGWMVGVWVGIVVWLVGEMVDLW